MKILHTEWSNGWGGQERRILAEMVGMAGRGHEITLATRPECRLLEKARAQGIATLTAPFRHQADLSSIVALARFIRQHEIDVVNTHSGIDSWVGGLAAWFSGRKTVLVRTRHINLPLHRTWHNFIHYLPDAVISCGSHVRQHLIDRCGFPADEVCSIPTGVDFPAFQPTLPRAQVRQGLSVPEDAFMALMVAEIRQVKRHDVAVRGFQHFVQGHPNGRLVLAGHGPIRGDIEALVASLDLTDKVLFLGEREDIPDLLAAADALVLSSESEGVPQAIVQAMGLAVPVVATRVGSIPELVQHEETGLLIESEDWSALASALARMADHPQEAAELAQRGRDLVWRRFSLATMLDHTEQLLESLVKARRG